MLKLIHCSMGSPDMIIHNYPEHEGVSRYKMEPPLSALRLRRSHISRPINNEEQNHFYQLCYMLAHWNFHREPSKLTCIRNMTPAALVFVKVKLGSRLLNSQLRPENGQSLAPFIPLFTQRNRFFLGRWNSAPAVELTRWFTLLKSFIQSSNR